MIAGICCGSVWSETEWGPSTHYDVQNLKEKLRTLDGNKMTKGGWLQYWSKFKEIVSALEQIKMKDEDENEIRGPLPPLEEIAIPDEPIDDSPEERQRYRRECVQYVRAMREATEDRDREYPNGGPVQNHRPTDELYSCMRWTSAQCQASISITTPNWRPRTRMSHSRRYSKSSAI